MTENIRIIGTNSSKWAPIQDGFFFKKHLTDNLSKLTETDKMNYIEDTVEILSRSINPSEPKDKNGLSSTGIVIGYIQSGKTASMEGLISLAKDNGFQIIILLSGVVSNLTKQTVDRVFTSTPGAGWNKIYEKDLSKFDIEGLTSDIIRCLKGYENTPEDYMRNETSLIIQMKNKTRINKLTDLFNNLNSRYDLSKVSCLIIDDEGDQHSLSAVNPRIDNQTIHIAGKEDTVESICEKYIISEDELIYLNRDKTSEESGNLHIKPGDSLIIERAESPIHRALRELRKSIPNHSFLSYTATPQASLIIPVIDFLSPKFAIILRPGEDYTGVNYFFDQNVISNYTRVIPSEELHTYSQDRIIPETLHTALKEFIIGVSIGYYHKEDFDGKNRTMMITPSQKVSEHYKYLNSVREILENWSEILEMDNSDSEDLYEDFYRVYLENIKKNYSSNIPEYDDLKKLILKALQLTKLQEINARGQTRIPSINWDNNYSLILVGGIGLERGYTVEGLTITYMSRPTSSQQDTVQQRARFAGYRKKYKDLVKIYLTDDLKDFYRIYTDAENFLNNSIKEFQKEESNQNLNNWKRVFMARRGTTLTRRGMTDKNFVRYGVRQIQQTLSHELSSEKQEENLKIYEFIKKLPLQKIQEISKRPDANRRNNCFISKGYKLEQSQEEILSKIQYHYDESAFFVDANSLITNYINKRTEKEKSNLELKIILMNLEGSESNRTVRERDSETRKINIHIGRSQAGGFCGDNRIHYDYLVNKTNGIEAVDTPTLQVYKFNNVRDETNPDFNKNDVVYFCLKLPRDIHQNSSLIRME